MSGPVVTGCRQQLRLPTITRVRLFEPMFVSRRIPPADHAFHVSLPSLLRDTWSTRSSPLAAASVVRLAVMHALL
ncbi:hypothetical protein C7T87_23055 [Xanthomonas hortorum pv. hederae]|nr:hypothetical protein C7T87_23055 [Xanthomonas hortorum pv. hederae]